MLRFRRDFSGARTAEAGRFAAFAAGCAGRKRRTVRDEPVGNSPVRRITLTHNDDAGLRTLSGGQYSIQVSGYLAVEQSAAPPLMVEASRSVRDVYAVLGKAADAEVQVQVKVDGAAYCTLTFPAGMTVSDAVDGNALASADRRVAGDAGGAVGGQQQSRGGPDGADSAVMLTKLTTGSGPAMLFSAAVGGGGA